MIKQTVFSLILAIVLSGCVTPVIRKIPILSDDDAPTVTHQYGVTDPQFRRTMGSLFGPPIIDGNRMTTLINGREIFPAMLSAIRSAEHSITFETYIYWSGHIGKQFADALSERARSGVPVHVIIDWFGIERLDQSFIDQMREAGVEVIYYNDFAWYNPMRWLSATELNNRTHRKILVIDGKVGFTGGVGIADTWDGNAESPEHWRDTHYRIEGPVVAQLQSAFADNWLESGGRLLDGDAYFPPLTSVGTIAAQAFKSSPSEATANIELLYHLAIASSTKSIKLSSSYFVPDESTLRMLADAAHRGVSVEVIVPGKHIDQKMVGNASKALWGDLLKAGVKIYEYSPTMFHCKVLVIDDYFVSVGSTNFDDRSFRLNDEANLNVFDSGIGEQQSRIFEDDKKRSKLVTLEQWEDRSIFQKLGENFTLLFRSEM